MNDIYALFQEAIKHPDAISELRNAVILARDRGESKEDILNYLESLRKIVNEPQEDVILDIMDFLSGWSSLHMKID